MVAVDVVEERKPATMADLEALPEGVKGEIIDGVLYTQPRPRSHHQAAILALGGELLNAFQSGRGGSRSDWWILPEPGIELARAPEVSPDIAGWRKARLPELPSEASINVVPDWVCEILSPSTRSYDQVVKRAFYARVGVAHLWYVDLEASAVMVHKLEGGRWLELGVFGRGGKMRADPFDTLELDLAQLLPR